MDIDENRTVWNGVYDWAEAGEEWSRAWGGSEAQWLGCIYPRIYQFVRCETILEIAPGFGRWTRFLKDLCTTMHAVDLSAQCVDYCNSRFTSDRHVRFYVNNGTSLEMIPDRSIDFSFSFDSLVHAEADVVRDYLAELKNKLRPDGVGFIHHSNLGACAQETPNLHCRARSMSASKFRDFCDEIGVCCVGQEIINWGQEELNDCFSLLTPQGSRWDRAPTMIENCHFMTEADLIKRRSRLYQVTAV